MRKSRLHRLGNLLRNCGDLNPSLLYFKANSSSARRNEPHFTKNTEKWKVGQSSVKESLNERCHMLASREWGGKAIQVEGPPGPLKPQGVCKWPQLSWKPGRHDAALPSDPRAETETLGADSWA